MSTTPNTTETASETPEVRRFIQISNNKEQGVSAAYEVREKRWIDVTNREEVIDEVYVATRCGHTTAHPCEITPEGFCVCCDEALREHYDEERNANAAQYEADLEREFNARQANALRDDGFINESKQIEEEIR